MTEAIRGARVLLAEDNDINQFVACEFLKLAGMVVDIANNGAECVTMVCSGGYDLVLMDIQMPQVDGLEAARRIRAVPGFETLPIVAMTANARSSDRDISLAAGMNDYLTKPINEARLFEVLVRWIKPREQPAGGALAKPVEHAEGDGLALPIVDGLDTQLGLVRVGSSTVLYRRVLRQFLDASVSAAANARDAISQERRLDAQRIAHNIKGTAATLGADGLSATAARLESALRDGPAEAVHPALEQLAKVLASFCGALAQYFAHFDRQVPASAGTAADQSQIMPTLRLLLELLAAGNAKAGDQAEILRVLAAGSAMSSTAVEIARLVQEVEFAAAQRFAESLVAQLKEIEK